MQVDAFWGYLWGMGYRHYFLFGAHLPLTDTAIKKAKSDGKPVKFSDGKGMYLLVNLRDLMTDIELILTMLGEATTKLHRDRDSKGMAPLKKDAKDGGAVAGRTRKDIEKQSGKPVISPGNFKRLVGKRVKKLEGGE